MLPVFINGDVNVNTFSFVANPDVNDDVVAYELKSKLIVFVVLVNGAEKVKAFSLVFNDVVVAYELKSKLIVFVLLVNGAENVKAFSLLFKFVIVA